MATHNTAKELLWPTDTDILVRVVFLYVGQGTSTIVIVADNDTYKVMLIDINLDAQRGGIDVPMMLMDLLGGEDLFAFVNSHPHDDHLRGIAELSEMVNILEVWHSGHKPSKKYGEAYEQLQDVIKKITDAGGKEITLERTDVPTRLGDAQYHVLSPSEWLTDDVNDEQADERYARIHEQCAVLKFGKDRVWVMLPGDANRNAFEKHITDHYGDAMHSQTLGASHHGSRSYFRDSEEDEPYVEALNLTDPNYIVISAPTQEESPHDHPHDDAVNIYAKKVGEDNILHTGKSHYSYICDIYRDGTYSGVQDDKGVLAQKYPLESEENSKDGNNRKSAPYVAPMIIGTRVDDRPMGWV